MGGLPVALALVLSPVGGCDSTADLLSETVERPPPISLSDAGLAFSDSAISADALVDSAQPSAGDATARSDVPALSAEPDFRAQLTSGVSAEALAEAFAELRVSCVDHHGEDLGTTMPIVDRPTVSFVDGMQALANAPAPTRDWLGDLSAVIVVWDPNACDREYTFDQQWDWAGLVVRGASLTDGRLLLPQKLSSEDINAIDVDSSGRYQACAPCRDWSGDGDFAGPDDSLLGDFPHLQLTIEHAKRTLVALSTQR